MYSSVNKLAHKYDMYPLLNSIVYFVNSTFVKKTNLPFISIYLFIVVIILNSIQYYKNDKNFLQNNIMMNSENDSNKVTLSNALLYVYDVIGINGFLSEGLMHILFFMLTYFCLALIEMNIGHVALLFLLLVDIMFQLTIGGIKSSLCINNISDSDRLPYSPYCCGSFVLYMSLGFVLYLIYKNMNSIFTKGFILFIIVCVWIGCILVDKYINFAEIKKEDSIITCYAFLWHAANFLLGLLSGIVLGN